MRLIGRNVKLLALYERSAYDVQLGPNSTLSFRGCGWHLIPSERGRYEYIEIQRERKRGRDRQRVREFVSYINGYSA